MEIFSNFYVPTPLILPTSYTTSTWFKSLHCTWYFFLGLYSRLDMYHLLVIIIRLIRLIISFVCFCCELVSAPLLNTLAISLFQCSCSAMAKKQTPPIDRPLVLSYRSQPEWQAGLKPPNLHACVVLTPMLLSPPPG